MSRVRQPFGMCNWRRAGRGGGEGGWDREIADLQLNL